MQAILEEHCDSADILISHLAVSLGLPTTSTAASL
jgi:SAM-dependent methyltransferase